MRRFIGFCHLFSPEDLLLELEEQENRDGRRFLLDLLIVHGAKARDSSRVACLVPDNTRYQPAGGQPTLPEGETDAELFKEVWRLAAEGSSPAEVEKSLPVDRYRIRCLFEHWQAEGVLAPVQTGGAPQTAG